MLLPLPTVFGLLVALLLMGRQVTLEADQGSGGESMSFH